MPKNTETAPQAAKRNLNEIHKRITDIKMGLDARSGSRADKADWADVGSLAHYLKQLTDIADSMHRRGEYAPDA